MKKLAIFVVAATLALGLAACGDKDNGKSNQGNNPSPNVEQGSNNGSGNNQSDAMPTVDELLEKSIAASASLKSYSMTLDMNQHVEVSMGEEKQEQDIVMKSNSDFVKDPLVMYQVLDIDMGEQGKQNMEQYITKDGAYTKVNGSWVKLPEEMNADLIASLDEASKPESQLENFKKIVKDTKVTAEGNDYLLTATLSGDNVKELAKQFMQQGQSEDLEAMLDAMNITELKVVSGLNKETYYPTRSDVFMVAEVEQDGQKVKMQLDLKSVINKYNELEEIVIPEEVLNAPSM